MRPTLPTSQNGTPALLFNGEAVRRLWTFLFFCIFATCLYVPVFGLDRDRTIHQFYHSAWTAKDGAPSQITALAQTEDGYLWVGSERGLYRFDGDQFEEFVAPDDTNLPSHSIRSLMSTPEGGLWISFNPSGLWYLKDGVMSSPTRPEAQSQTEVYCFAHGIDGQIWAGTRAGLIVLDGSNWREIGKEWNLSSRRIWSMFVDRDGTLWVSADDTIVYLKRGAHVFQETGIRDAGIPRFDQSADGRLWIAEYDHPIRRLPLSDRYSATVGPEIRVPDIKLLGFDRDGGMWMCVKGDGIRRIRFPDRLGARNLGPDDPDIEAFKVSDGLTDNSVNNLLEDREGNIWISSNKGLDRFRYSHLVPVTLPPGYRDLTLMAGADGEVWVASAALKPILLIKNGAVLPKTVPMEIASVYRDTDSVAWWGGHGGIWRQSGQQFKFFPQPKGLTFDNLDWLWEVIPDNAQTGLWIGLGDVGLLSFKDAIWKNQPRPTGLSDQVPSASYKDPNGRIWLGYNENRVSVMDGEVVQNYTHDDGLDIGRIRTIRGSGTRIWLGGELGLAIFSNGQFRTIRTANGPPFGTVSGIIETSDGGLWLNELHGIIRIDSSEVEQAAANPNHAITYQTFGYLDGLPGGPQMDFRSSTAIAGTDGRLWFATDNGLAWIEPSRITQNPVPPPTTIRSLDTDSNKYGVREPVFLPPGTTSFRIAYTAMSLSVPERVHFRYKLEGTGEDWQDAGTRREAVYNNLGPGEYRFHVIACNNDGIWNETGSTLNFSIAPAWYQTALFRILLFTAFLLFVLLLYRLRVRQIANALSARFDERLAERTRLAQELHDTFLQTIQGSKMVADDALDQKDDPIRLRRAMEQLADWLGQAVTEGRAALNSLRTSTTETNDLAQALRRATETCMVQGSMVPTFSVVGQAKDMHPIVRDEIYRIGYEAIRNACAHSEASDLDVELVYDKDLVIRVKDNGIGMDPIIASEGKEGHFGIVGMRERSSRIRSKLILKSSASGTEITLIVPGEIAFRTSFRSTDL